MTIPPLGNARTTRRAVMRDVLAVGTAVTLSNPAGAMSAPDPDTALVALIEAAVRDRIASARKATADGCDASDEWYETVVFPRMDRIRATRAHTARGVAAKLLMHIHDFHLDTHEELLAGPASRADDPEVRGLADLMEDALALAVTLGEPSLPGGLRHG